ncbi:step ii splicing factor slu7, putative [Ichthyophthirius multifiliis]|uniref:Pre-mRNA-splicing factor SLU7 n=1 Tax=Ichthyophthirius multifiliis TaxID=5932 RepID=G0QYY4_ICHMU|nr:step ii splicing factor slu7, putative [Ichthyophthirius multifiliis]EGR29555.1 step ii splicing factor slu7, putative [Ichthyophthirius multifiliis]|eukprot:XP_004030791.1 step ii splicing factor slu7, putative [Ichthyophthirius multifiliis]
MRENPNPNDLNSIFKGENSLRTTGDAVKLINQEKFAWDQVEKNGLSLSSIANPTLTEKVFKEMLDKDKNIKNMKIKQILQVYGGEEHLDVDYDLIVGQTEKYAEYSADGQQLDIYNHKRSKYIEDVFINNHTTVWGSWYSDVLGWGFACCHNNLKDSVCSGDKGKKEALVKEFKIRKQKDEDFKRVKELNEAQKKNDGFKAPMARKKQVDKNENGQQQQVQENGKVKKIEKKESIIIMKKIIKKLLKKILKIIENREKFLMTL